jgi:hypothetical protein
LILRKSRASLTKTSRGRVTGFLGHWILDQRSRLHQRTGTRGARGADRRGPLGRGVGTGAVADRPGPEIGMQDASVALGHRIPDGRLRLDSSYLKFEDPMWTVWIGRSALALSSGY